MRVLNLVTTIPGIILLTLLLAATVLATPITVDAQTGTTLEIDPTPLNLAPGTSGQGIHPARWFRLLSSFCRLLCGHFVVIGC